MKTLIIFFVFSFLSFNYDNLDKCKGLGNFKFGSAINQYNGLVLEFENRNAQLYTAKSDEIKINNVYFDFIRITFIKNKLSVISLSTKQSSGSVFFKYLVNNYGTPSKNKNNYEWLGKNIQIIFENYKNSKDAAVDFYFKP